jgi:hypothetical protein
MKNKRDGCEDDLAPEVYMPCSRRIVINSQVARVAFVACNKRCLCNVCISVFHTMLHVACYSRPTSLPIESTYSAICLNENHSHLLSFATGLSASILLYPVDSSSTFT